MFCTHCAAEVLSIASNLCYSCGKELNEKADEPKSEMSDDSSAVSANDLITEMFHRGYRHDVTVHLLGYKMHLTTLKRRLIDLGLKRKGKTEMDESQIELEEKSKVQEDLQVTEISGMPRVCACPSFFGCQSCCCYCKI